MGFQNREGEGAAGGRAATPFAAEKGDLLRREILERHLFNCLIAFGCVYVGENLEHFGESSATSCRLLSG